MNEKGHLSILTKRFCHNKLHVVLFDIDNIIQLYDLIGELQS